MKKRKTANRKTSGHSVVISDSTFTMHPPVVTPETAEAVRAIAEALKVAASALVKPEMGPLLKFDNPKDAA